MRFPLGSLLAFSVKLPLSVVILALTKILLPAPNQISPPLPDVLLLMMSVSTTMSLWAYTLTAAPVLVMSVILVAVIVFESSSSLVDVPLSFVAAALPTVVFLIVTVTGSNNTCPPWLFSILPRYTSLSPLDISINPPCP